MGAIKEAKEQLRYMSKKIGASRANRLMIDILNRYYTEEYDKELEEEY